MKYLISSCLFKVPHRGGISCQVWETGSDLRQCPEVICLDLSWRLRCMLAELLRVMGKIMLQEMESVLFAMIFDNRQLGAI